LDVQEIHPRWRVHPVLPPLKVSWQHIDPDRLSVLALPRNGRPKATRRLKTSAEVVQKAADRMEKVRRCGSCHKIGYNRHRCPGLLSESSQATGTKERAHVTDDNEAMTEEDEVDDGSGRDADFEGMSLSLM
ncbi:hypothetical protein V1523DRAFT_355313, partial [Lipomyces doorenjongii]